MSPKRSIPAARSTFPGSDDITRVVLANGITVLSRANFNSPSVVIGGYLQCGGLFDPDDKLGLADFTAVALMRGTARHSFHQLFDALESVGANLSFSAGVHTAGFTGRSLSEDLPLLLRTLAEALRQPAFPDEQVEKLRAQMLTGLAIRAQDTAEMASLTFDQIVYAGHPYARPEDGWPETIKAITRDDLDSFHRRHYGPRGLILAVAGAVDPHQAVEQVEKALGAWSNPGQPEPPALPALTPLRKVVNRKITIAGKSQTDIVIGTSGPTRKSPDFMSASLGNSILGQFGMSGRIGDVVREKSGLAYYAYSSLNAGIGPGTWEVSAGVNPKNVEKTCELIRKELTRFIKKGITVDELADSQSNFVGRLPLSLESNAGVVNALLNIERFDLGLDYYRTYPGLVKKVRPRDVLGVAKKYLDPERLAIAIAGP